MGSSDPSIVICIVKHIGDPSAGSSFFPSFIGTSVLRKYNPNLSSERSFSGNSVNVPRRTIGAVVSHSKKSLSDAVKFHEGHKIHSIACKIVDLVLSPAPIRQTTLESFGNVIKAFLIPLKFAISRFVILI